MTDQHTEENKELEYLSVFYPVSGIVFVHSLIKILGKRSPTI